MKLRRRLTGVLAAASLAATTVTAPAAQAHPAPTVPEIRTTAFPVARPLADPAGIAPLLFVLLLVASAGSSNGSFGGVTDATGGGAGDGHNSGAATGVPGKRDGTGGAGDAAPGGPGIPDNGIVDPNPGCRDNHFPAAQPLGAYNPNNCGRTYYPTPADKTLPRTVRTKKMRAEIFDSFNDARRHFGIDPVPFTTPALNQSAQAWAERDAKLDVSEHMEINQQPGGNLGGASEIIAPWLIPADGDIESFPAWLVIAQYLRSKGHRAGVLNRNVKRIGIGIAVNKKAGAVYVVIQMQEHNGTDPHSFDNSKRAAGFADYNRFPAAGASHPSLPFDVPFQQIPAYLQNMEFKKRRARVNRQLGQAINEARRHYGLSPLEVDDALVARANWAANKANGRDNKQPEANWSWATSSTHQLSNAPGQVTGLESIPADAVVADMLKNPDTRARILGSRHRRVGVGVSWIRIDGVPQLSHALVMGD